MALGKRLQHAIRTDTSFDSHAWFASLDGRRDDDTATVLTYGDLPWHIGLHFGLGLGRGLERPTLIRRCPSMYSYWMYSYLLVDVKLVYDTSHSIPPLAPSAHIHALEYGTYRPHIP